MKIILKSEIKISHFNNRSEDSMFLVTAFSGNIILGYFKR